MWLLWEEGKQAAMATNKSKRAKGIQGAAGGPPFEACPIAGSLPCPFSIPTLIKFQFGLQPPRGVLCSHVTYSVTLDWHMHFASWIVSLPIVGTHFEISYN